MSNKTIACEVCAQCHIHEIERRVAALEETWRRQNPQAQRPPAGAITDGELPFTSLIGAPLDD